MRKLSVFILLACFYGMISAQTIEFNLSALAGSPYSIHLFKGIKNDTVQTGTFPANGRLTFTLPEANKNYVGMVYVGFGQNGQSLILNKENFSVNLDNTGLNFAGSVENEFLKSQFQQQQALFGKIDVITRGTALYQDDAKLLPVFKAEFKRLSQQYRTQQKELDSNPLYAARYIRMVELLNGSGSEIHAPGDEAAKTADLTHYFSEQMNMDELYTSGLWNPVISSTFDWFPDKKEFGNTMVKALKRVISQDVFEAFANDLMTICEQYGWTDAENTIADYLLSSGRVSNPQGKLYMAVELAKVKPGTPAYPIAGIDNLANSLLMFYESGCSNCKMQLEEMKKHYPALQRKGVRVITIAADTNEEVFTYHSKEFPWADKLIDYEGFDGVNFKNYGVLGTPTFYTINSEGKIVGRFPRLIDTGLLE